MMRLDSLTTIEFQEWIAKGPVIFLPIGATEAHGPHLPLSTDSLQPEFIADAIAENVDGLVAPPIRYALHSSTKNIPGTISLTFGTTMRLVQDVLTSLYENGGRKFVVLAGHAGSSHMMALRLACTKIVTAHRDSPSDAAY